jgi:hypothetical protein
MFAYMSGEWKKEVAKISNFQEVNCPCAFNLIRKTSRLELPFTRVSWEQHSLLSYYTYISNIQISRKL